MERRSASLEIHAGVTIPRLEAEIAAPGRLLHNGARLLVAGETC
jgi:hypothetical protein